MINICFMYYITPVLFGFQDTCVLWKTLDTNGHLFNFNSHDDVTYLCLLYSFSYDENFLLKSDNTIYSDDIFYVKVIMHLTFFLNSIKCHSLNDYCGINVGDVTHCLYIYCLKTAYFDSWNICFGDDFIFGFI